MPVTAEVLSPPALSDGATGVKRRYGTATVTTHASDLASCDSLDVRDFREIAVKPPASATTITVHASETAAGTYVLVDNIGTNGVITCPASKWTTLDTTKIGPFGFLKFFSSTAGEMAIVGKT